MGINVLNGGIILALMSVPIIVSIGEDALKAVPDSYREAGLALGATRWQLVYRVLLPAARNGLLAGSGCPPQFTTQKPYTLYPAEAQDWARRQNIPQPPEVYSPLCPGEQTADHRRLEGWEDGRMEGWAKSTPPTFQSSNLPIFHLILTSPDQGSHYRLSPEIPQPMQQIDVAARTANGVSLRQVTLLVDGHPLAMLTDPPYRALWPMAAGTHVFTAVGVDTAGNELRGNSVFIEVAE